MYDRCNLHLEWSDVRYREEMKHKEGTDPQILLPIEVTLKERRNKGFAEPLTKGR